MCVQKARLNCAAAVALVGLLWGVALAQTDPKGKSHTLHGTVEAINNFAISIRVNQERIAGYSDARAATYGVDDPAMLEKWAIGSSRRYTKKTTGSMTFGS